MPTAKTTSTAAIERLAPESAAIVAIGNELLSGKVRDENLLYLSRELRRLGVPLRLALIVPDEIPAIVQAIAIARAQASLVITTGGVGPTHDDVTLPALAAAFGRELQRDGRLAELIATSYRGELNDDLLRMADVPAGAELLHPDAFFVPIVRVENVYAFPGEPRAMRLLFEAWKETLRQEPWALARLQLDLDEGLVAPLLRELQESDPQLQIGSYPRFDAGAPYRVLVTLEGKDAARVGRLRETLLARLTEAHGAAALVKIETESETEILTGSD